MGNNLDSPRRSSLWIVAAAISLLASAGLIGCGPQVAAPKSTDTADREVSKAQSAAPAAEPTPIEQKTEQAEPSTQKSPPADEYVSRSTGMKFRLIPAGEFMMGCDQSPEEIVRIAQGDGADLKPEFMDAELPQHRVEITRSFYMGVHEVTQQEYFTIMGRNPSSFSATGTHSGDVTGQDTHQYPVESVTWFDAIEMCNQSSMRDGLPAYYELLNIDRGDDQEIRAALVTVKGGTGYRLPTEAEWEYACRAGTTTPFHFGDDSNGSQANVNGDYPYGTSMKGNSLKRTTETGRYTPNAFGLYDMHGNVCEWCFDEYDENAYKMRNGITTDPLVITGVNGRRLLRGGCWRNAAWAARSAYRYRFAPDYRVIYFGFRLCRTS